MNNGFIPAKIGSICRLVNGRAFKPSDWSTEGIAIVRIQNLNDESKLFNYYQGDADERHLIDDGDVLLSWSGTPGTSFGCFIWNRGKGVLNQHIFKVHVDEGKVDKEYFVFAVNSVLDEMIAEAHGGVGLRHITKGKLEALQVPVHVSLKEQQRIVARIKELIARVHEIQQLRLESVREGEAVFASVLAENYLSIREACERKELGSLTIESRYGTNNKCNGDSSGTPILRIPNVANGVTNLEDLKFCELNERELEILTLQDGDLLIVRTNGSPDLVGRCAVFRPIDRSCGFASYLIRFRLDTTKVEPQYVAFFLESTEGRDAIASIRKTSAGQFNVNSENLQAIKIPCPSLSTQTEMVERMFAQRQVVNQIREGLVEKNKEVVALQHAILRKAFAGEL